MKKMASSRHKDCKTSMPLLKGNKKSVPSLTVNENCFELHKNLSKLNIENAKIVEKKEPRPSKKPSRLPVRVIETKNQTTPANVDPVQVYAAKVGVVPGPANEILKKIDFIEREPGLLSTHLILEDKDTFKFYRNELAKFSGDDMHSTVKEICQNFISDEVLKDFSYMGKTSSKGTKKRFKQFDNLTKVVVLATMQSMNSKYEEIFGIKKILSDKKKQKLYEEIHSYFTKEYFKHATTRFNRVK